MEDKFKFYTEKEDIKDNRKATREIKKEWDNFRIKIEKILIKYKHIGASDTQSREEIVNYFQKELEKGGFI